jgi:hypothetical protein
LWSVAIPAGLLFLPLLILLVTGRVFVHLDPGVFHVLSATSSAARSPTATF